MRAYVGTKLVFAEPAMKDGREGFTVVYSDGYRSWSPYGTFIDSYKPVLDMGTGFVSEFPTGEIVLRPPSLDKGCDAQNLSGQYVKEAPGLYRKQAGEKAQDTMPDTTAADDMYAIRQRREAAMSYAVHFTSATGCCTMTEVIALAVQIENYLRDGTECQQRSMHQEIREAMSRSASNQRK